MRPSTISTEIIDSKRKKLFLTVIAATLFWGAIILGIYIYSERVESLKRENKEYIAEKWLKDRMKKHGTDSAICDKGVCYFYRNGKKIIL